MGTQHTNRQQEGGRLEQGSGARHAFQPMPLTLSKKELAHILECLGLNGPDYRRLRQKFFTASVLNRIGISSLEYTKTRLFDRETTIKIIEVLEIQEECAHYAQARH